jgi:protein-arginine kinase activator protein McsA
MSIYTQSLEAQLADLSEEVSALLAELGSEIALVSGQCEVCGLTFRRRKSTRRFCSATCRQRAHRSRP